MIYEYALEPELVATWTDRQVCGFVKKSFEFGTARVVSQYPRRWRKLVWDAYGGGGDLRRKRLEVLLDHLSEQSIRRRDYTWEPDVGGWIENAQREHQKCPFHAIVVRTDHKCKPHVVIEDDLYSGESDRWAVSNSLVVAREAAAMADAVASLLRISRRVIFVDPYFAPGEQRYLRPFRAFLERLVHSRPGDEPERIEIHASTEYECTEEFFRGKCTKVFCRSVPQGVRVFVRRLSQKPGGESLHNRYILTERGGIYFGAGLDEGKEGESATDDLALMDRHHYDLRWSQYRGDPPAGFKQEGDPIEVVGTRPLATP